jgi:NTP pyrophosphatase (non-canonical NTP hydrolase)
MLSDLTLQAVRAESIKAYAKHGERALLGNALTTLERLAALVEETGEVARALTYDNAGGRAHLVAELLQVASVAASWAEWLDGGGPYVGGQLVRGGAPDGG